jgi:hypothetical protein
MSAITSSLRQIQSAPASLPGLLNPALLAFEDILTEIRLAQDPASPLFAALTMAAVAAANGRDAMLFAPSLSWSACTGVPRQESAAPADLAGPDTAELAALCMTLASRLDQAAASPVVPGDRRACQDAARCARDIRDLIAGTLP